MDTKEIKPKIVIKKKDKDLVENSVLILPKAKKKLDSTPEIENIRLVYKDLRKNLRNKGLNIPFIGISKRKGVYGIKIQLTDEKRAKDIPFSYKDVLVHKIEIVEPPPVPVNPVYNYNSGYQEPVLTHPKFTIEKVKWEWAKKVQQKDVYRDDEFVRTQTKEDALEAAGWLLNNPKGLTYTITVKRGEEYFTYYRHSMPCLGGLVKYRDSHGPKYSMNSYFPRDIRVAFPEGKVVFIGCNRPSSNPETLFKNAYYQFLFSEESPWVSAFGNKDSIIFSNNYFILTNMETDPTVFYSLMRLASFSYAGYGSQRKNWNVKADLLLSKCVGGQADPRRLCGQKPIRISGGYWSDDESWGYTRAHCEHIFHTSLPNKFKDFHKLKGYPQATQNNKYFIDTMKEKFGVNVSKITKENEKQVEQALVEAWNYFKEESKSLTDSADI